MSRNDVDTSSPDLAAAWKSMSDQKSDNNWCLFQLEKQDNKQVLKLAGQGAGGYEELLPHLKENQSAVMFGALKVIGKDDRQTLEALRPKFVFFTFIGDKVNVLQRAKVSVQRGAAEALFNGIAVRLDVDGQLSNFSRKEIGRELIRCGGAHMPTSFVFGPNDDYPVTLLDS